MITILEDEDDEKTSLSEDDVDNEPIKKFEDIFNEIELDRELSLKQLKKLKNEIDIEEYLNNNVLDEDDIVLDFDESELKFLEPETLKYIEENNIENIPDIVKIQKKEVIESFSERLIKIFKEKIKLIIIILVIANILLLIVILVELSYLKRIRNENLDKILISVPQNASNMGEIYVNLVEDFNGEEVTLFKINFGRNSTRFYFTSGIDLYKKTVTLMDKNNVLYNMKYGSVNLQQYGNNEYSVLIFEPIEEGSREFTLAIYDEITKESLKFNFKLYEKLIYGQSRFSREVLLVDTYTKNYNLSLNNMVFSDGIVEIPYRITVNNKDAEVVFRDKSSGLIYLMQNRHIRNLINDVVNVYLGDNEFIGVFEFEPINDFYYDVSLSIDNIYLKYDVNNKIIVDNLNMLPNYTIDLEEYIVYFDSFEVINNEHLILSVFAEDTTNYDNRMTLDLDINLMLNNIELNRLSTVHEPRSTKIYFDISQFEDYEVFIHELILDVDNVYVKQPRIDFVIGMSELYDSRDEESLFVEAFLKDYFAKFINYLHIENNSLEEANINGRIFSEYMKNHNRIEEYMNLSFDVNILDLIIDESTAEAIVQEQAIFTELPFEDLRKKDINDIYSFNNIYLVDLQLINGEWVITSLDLIRRK